MWVELRLLAFGTQNVCTHKHPNTQHLETVECSSHLGAEPGVRGAHLPLSLQATLETSEKYQPACVISVCTGKALALIIPAAFSWLAVAHICSAPPRGNASLNCCP